MYLKPENGSMMGFAGLKVYENDFGGWFRKSVAYTLSIGGLNGEAIVLRYKTDEERSVVVKWLTNKLENAMKSGESVVDLSDCPNTGYTIKCFY